MIDEGKLFGRSLAFPPRIGPDGRVAWSAGAPNIRESIQIILMTAFEERLFLPEFGAGLQAYLFQPNTVATHRLIEERTTTALARWEPRIKVVSITVRPDAGDPQAALLLVHYRLVATGASDQLGVSLQFSS